MQRDLGRQGAGRPFLSLLEVQSLSQAFQALSPRALRALLGRCPALQIALRPKVLHLQKALIQVGLRLRAPRLERHLTCQIHIRARFLAKIIISTSKL